MEQIQITTLPSGQQLHVHESGLGNLAGTGVQLNAYESAMAQQRAEALGFPTITRDCNAEQR